MKKSGTTTPAIAAASLSKSLVIGGREVDGRTLEARRYREICSNLRDDIGVEPSTAQWLLIQRAAGLSVQIENIETIITSGEAIDTHEYSKLINTVVVVLKTLGLRREARDITPSKRIDPHTAALMEGNA